MDYEVTLMYCTLMKRHVYGFYEDTQWSLELYDRNESRKEKDNETEEGEKKSGELVSAFLCCVLTQITAIIFDHNRRKTKYGEGKTATTIRGSVIGGMFCNMYSYTHW
jgi:hypothetical protein